MPTQNNIHEAIYLSISKKGTGFSITTSYNYKNIFKTKIMISIRSIERI